MTDSGDIVGGDTVIEVGDDLVRVSFRPADVAAAAGVTLTAGAVVDRQGDPNPVGTPGR